MIWVSWLFVIFVKNVNVAFNDYFYWYQIYESPLKRQDFTVHFHWKKLKMKENDKTHDKHLSPQVHCAIFIVYNYDYVIYHSSEQ